MRKFLLLVLATIMLLPAGVCRAEEYNSVELEIQLGSYVAYVNGEAISIEAPFLKDGHTVAPVEAVSMAFGNEKKDKITYNGVTLKFKDGSEKVTVGKEEKQMPVPAETINGSLMVPIRFVCDIFNALIEFEEATGIVKVSKSADFTELFNKPMSGYWCNEDYGWMIQLPTDYDHTTGEYDGSMDRFVNGSGDAAFSVLVQKNNYQTVEQIRTYILAQNGGEIIRNEEIVKLPDGTPAFYLELEDTAGILTLHGEYFVAVEFVTTSADKFEVYREDARKGLKSLTFEIDPAKKPENVSELNEGGYTVHTDKVLGFVVNRMKSWTEPEYIGTNVAVWEYKNYPLLNKLCSDEFFDGEMKVSVFTAEEGDTPETLAQAEKERVLRSYNRKYLFGVEQKNFEVKEDKASQVDYTIIYNGRKQITKNKFFVKDGYVYKVEHYVIYSAGVDEALLNLEYVNKMFDSIRINGANASKLGVVVDSARRVDESIKQTYRNQHGNFEISVPAAWATGASANLVSAINVKKTIEVEAERISGFKTIDAAKTYYMALYPGAKFSKVKFAGREACKMTSKSLDKNGDTICNTAYFFVKDNELYLTGYMIKEVYDTKENEAFLEEIVKSFRLL